MKFKDSDKNEYTIEWKRPDARKYGQCAGYYYYPLEGQGKIQIDPRLSHQMILNTLIHEVTHAHFDDATETETTKFANCLSRLIYNELKFRSEDLEQHCA